jgi:hypothetical protein
MDVTQPESQRLRRDVEWALRRALDPSDVLPMLHRLARTAPAGSDESVFAHRQLAELLVERHPWRATLHARKVLAHRTDDDRAWAVLALSQTLLGNYRFAASGYHRALMSAPKNPWYAHNLGHLLDVALGRAHDALFWLRSAYAGAAWSAEIATSFSHALARAGKLGEAKKVLARAMKRGASREQTALWRWLEKGAPPEKDAPPPRPPMPAQWPTEPGNELSRPPRKSRPAASALEAAVVRGLSSLPLDPKQRARARTLARDAAFYCASNDGEPIQSLAAAIAYAIVYVDHVPLTQAEVAACFRVSASALRGRFKELRSQLDLTPGDARYATPRSS